MDETDIRYAREAIATALEADGEASPNPLVGTVIVRDGIVVGRGTHRFGELKHAEVLALDEAGDSALGATVYVNLEPCSHHGRTPPCVDALIAAGVARVVASMQDPAPYVNGRGFARLREAGIRVDVGVELDAAERVNERYLASIATGRPFVLVKTASTLDGRVATRTGESKWITGPEAREASQALRRSYDAILVGVGTVCADDPELTYRGGFPKRMPLLRAVIDPTLRIPFGSRLVHTARREPLVIYTSRPESNKAESLRQVGAEVVELGSGAAGLDLGRLLDDLGARRVHGLIVEGGPETSARFLAAGLVDKVTFFLAPRLLGGRDSIGAVGGAGSDSLEAAVRLERVEVRRIGEDIEVTGYPVRSAPE